LVNMGQLLSAGSTVYALARAQRFAQRRNICLP
jgi:hypothetical protein